MNTILAHQVKHSIKSSCLEIRKMIGGGGGLVELKFWPNTWLYISQMKESKTPGTKSNKLHQFIFTLVYIPKKSKVNQFFSFLFASKGNIIISTYKQFLQWLCLTIDAQRKNYCKQFCADKFCSLRNRRQQQKNTKLKLHLFVWHHFCT